MLPRNNRMKPVEQKLHTSRVLLTGLLAMLRALHWHYWTAHWQASGESSYGDHLLFERFYTGMVDRIDVLAEKIAGFHGHEALSSVPQSALTRQWLDRWAAHSDLFQRSLAAEADLQQALVLIRGRLENKGGLTLGLDDYLTGIASDHETNVYLLQQRCPPVRVSMASLVKTAKPPAKLKGKEQKELEKAEKRKKRQDPAKRIKSFSQIQKKHREYLKNKREEKDPAKKKVKFKTPEEYAGFLASQGYWGWKDEEEESEGGTEEASKEEQADRMVKETVENFSKMDGNTQNELREYFVEEYKKAVEAGADMDDEKASLILLEKVHKKSRQLTGQEEPEEEEKEAPSLYQRAKNAIEQAFQNAEEKEATREANLAKAALLQQAEEDYQRLEQAKNEALDDLKRKMRDMSDEDLEQVDKELMKAGFEPVWDPKTVPPDPEDPPPKRSVLKEKGLLGVLSSIASFFKKTDPRTLEPKKPSRLSKLLYGEEGAQRREEEKLAKKIEKFETKQMAKENEKMIKDLIKKRTQQFKEQKKFVDRIADMYNKANFPNFNRLSRKEAAQYGLLVRGKVVKPSKAEAKKIRQILAAHAVEALGAEQTFLQSIDAVAKGKVGSHMPFYRYADYKVVFASDVREKIQGVAQIVMDRMMVPSPEALASTVEALADKDNFSFEEEKPKTKKKASSSLVSQLEAPGMLRVGEYFEGPWHSEVLQLVQSKQPSNIHQENLEKGAPPTPADLKDQPGGAQFSTLQRYVTRTEERTPPEFRPFRGDRR